MKSKAVGFRSGFAGIPAVARLKDRCGIKWKSLDDLLRGPLCSRMSCNIEMDNASAFMSQHHQDEQNLKPNRVYREEVDRNEL